MLGPAHRPRRAACAILVALLALAMSGCVGPNFVPPAAPAVDGYLPGKLASPGPTPSGPKVPGQHFVTGEDVSARWWAAFRSQPLNHLVRDSVNHSPTLQSAEAAIKIAQYNALAQRGLFFPQVTGNSTSQQILVANPGQVPPVPTEGPQSQFSLVTNQLTVTFVPDIWGANFRAVENLDAVTEQQLFQLEAAYLTLTSNVVTAAIQEASLRGQITETKRVIAIERHLLDILKRQFDRFENLVARCADRIRVMLLHLYPHRAVVLGFDWRDVRRWIRRCCTEEQRQYHFASLYGRCPLAVGPCSEEAPLSEDACTRVISKDIPPEFSACDAGNPVMTGDTFVDERIVGRPQVDGVVIVLNLVLQEQSCFGFKRPPQRVIDTLRPVEGAPQHPGLKKIGGQAIRFRVVQHSTDLLLEYSRISKRAFLYGVQQSGVGV